MAEQSRRPWFERTPFLVVVLGLGLYRALTPELGKWLAFPVSLALVAVAWVIFVAVVEGVRLLWENRRRVVALYEPIPRWYGVSYVETYSNSRMCHIIPFNLLVGATKVLSNRLKKGTGRKGGTRTKQSEGPWPRKNLIVRSRT